MVSKFLSGVLLFCFSVSSVFTFNCQWDNTGNENLLSPSLIVTGMAQNVLPTRVENGIAVVYSTEQVKEALRGTFYRHIFGPKSAIHTEAVPDAQFGKRKAFLSGAASELIKKIDKIGMSVDDDILSEYLLEISSAFSLRLKEFRDENITMLSVQGKTDPLLFSNDCVGMVDAKNKEIFISEKFLQMCCSNGNDTQDLLVKFLFNCFKELLRSELNFDTNDDFSRAMILVENRLDQSHDFGNFMSEVIKNGCNYAEICLAIEQGKKDYVIGRARRFLEFAKEYYRSGVREAGSSVGTGKGRCGTYYRMLSDEIENFEKILGNVNVDINDLIFSFGKLNIEIEYFCNAVNQTRRTPKIYAGQKEIQEHAKYLRDVFSMYAYRNGLSNIPVGTNPVGKVDTTVGKLKIIPKGLPNDIIVELVKNVDANTILVFEDYPDETDVPKVAGFIIENSMKNGSHAGERARQWNVPCVYLPDAQNILKELNGCWVGISRENGEFFRIDRIINQALVTSKKNKLIETRAIGKMKVVPVPRYNGVFDISHFLGSVDVPVDQESNKMKTVSTQDALSSKPWNLMLLQRFLPKNSGVSVPKGLAFGYGVYENVIDTDFRVLFDLDYINSVSQNRTNDLEKAIYYVIGLYKDKTKGASTLKEAFESIPVGITLRDVMTKVVDDLVLKDASDWRKGLTCIGNLVRYMQLPSGIKGDILEQTKKMFPNGGDCIIRSAMLYEDMYKYSFSGEYESVEHVDVSNPTALIGAIKNVWASMWKRLDTVEYLLSQNISPVSNSASIFIMDMIPLDKGVVFLAPSHFEGKKEGLETDVVEGSINASLGAARNVVTPGKKSVSESWIVSYNVSTQGPLSIKCVKHSNDLSVLDGEKPVLAPDEVRKFLQMGEIAEIIFGVPMDVEAGLYGDKFYCFQSRPIPGSFDISSLMILQSRVAELARLSDDGVLKVKEILEYFCKGDFSSIAVKWGIYSKVEDGVVNPENIVCSMVCASAMEFLARKSRMIVSPLESQDHVVYGHVTPSSVKIDLKWIEKLCEDLISGDVNALAKMNVYKTLVFLVDNIKIVVGDREKIKEMFLSDTIKFSFHPVKINISIIWTYYGFLKDAIEVFRNKDGKGLLYKGFKISDVKFDGRQWAFLMVSKIILGKIETALKGKESIGESDLEYYNEIIGLLQSILLDLAPELRSELVNVEDSNQKIRDFSQMLLKESKAILEKLNSVIVCELAARDMYSTQMAQTNIEADV